MRTFGLLIAGLTLLSNSAAHAAPQTWVSSTGSGAACTRAAPCATFLAAVLATDAGGVISVIDSFQDPNGTFTINKSLTVRAEGADAGMTFTGVSAHGGNVQITTAATDTVVLDGVNSVGGGILIDGAGKVIIRNCKIGFSPGAGGAAFAYGIRTNPNGRLHLIVSDTSIENTGGSAGGAGIEIIPASGGTAQVTLERVSVNGNLFGVAVDGTGSTGGINMTIKDSVFASNVNDGVVATTPSGGAPIGVTVVNSALTNNGYGTRAIGNNVTVRVEGSKIIGNSTGIVSSGGGAVITGGGNTLQANGTNGSFAGSYTLE